MKPHEVSFMNALHSAEARVMEELAQSYARALANIRRQLLVLEQREQTISVFQQMNFKQAQERQLARTIDALARGEIRTIREYKAWMYRSGHIAVSQGLNRDGVSLIIPIDPNVMTASLANQVQGLRFSDRIGIQMDKFHNDVSRTINAGLAQNASFAEIAREIARVAQSRLYAAYRIAVTEGNRVLNQSKFYAMTEAKRRGADIVKQWHSALMETTRDNHAAMHNQIREVDEPFENPEGATAMHPLGFGIAREDINCHCTLLQRARWALDDAKILDDLRGVDGMDRLIEMESFSDYSSFYESENRRIATEQDRILGL